jgi:hypothetical protein
MGWDHVSMELRWNDNDRGNPKNSRKTCLSATLSTTNPTWTDLGTNPGRRGEKPATNRLSYVTTSNTHVTFHLHFAMSSLTFSKTQATLLFVPLSLKAEFKQNLSEPYYTAELQNLFEPNSTAGTTEFVWAVLYCRSYRICLSRIIMQELQNLSKPYHTAGATEFVWAGLQELQNLSETYYTAGATEFVWAVL